MIFKTINKLKFNKNYFQLNNLKYYIIFKIIFLKKFKITLKELSNPSYIITYN